jgi:hypothetical protein
MATGSSAERFDKEEEHQTKPISIASMYYSLKMEGF